MQNIVFFLIAFFRVCLYNVSMFRQVIGLSQYKKSFSKAQNRRGPLDTQVIGGIILTTHNSQLTTHNSQLTTHNVNYFIIQS